MEDDETVELGGLKVPSQFKTRWDELIAKNKELKTQLFEAKTTIEESAGKTAPELETSKGRIAELEAQVKGFERSSVLGPDNVADNADLNDYLDYQYGKLTAAEGETKPSFGDWYKEAKVKNPLIAAAVGAAKVAVEAPAEGAGKPKAGEGAPVKVKASTAPTEAPVAPAPKASAAPPRTIAGKAPGVTDSAYDAGSIAGLDPASFKANKAEIRKQLFGGS
jgi:hypothetical protein